jgi:hypothetical protein
MSNLMKQDTIQKIPLIPSWMLWVQTFCFSVLYAIWVLPETILVRHICLIAGAIVGAYQIYRFRKFFLTKKAVGVWAIFGLFIWATIHLFFLSYDFSLQLHEFQSIWKRTALGALFALGFGMALSQQAPQKQSRFFVLIYVGLIAPTIIFFIRYGFTHFGAYVGISVPDYWTICEWKTFCYVPKIDYVCFCVPTLAVALGLLKNNFIKGKLFAPINAVYALTIFAIFFVFYAENIKNGVLYGILILLIISGSAAFRNFKKHWIQKTLFMMAMLAIVLAFLINHVQYNESWKTFGADAKIALDTQTYRHWIYDGHNGYPNNELGNPVSITNYMRLAWGKTGLELIAQYPLGYGLIEKSFGHLSKINWPESKLHQSHSGWIDLTLGIGLPGVTIILCAAFFALRNLHFSQREVNSPLLVMSYWTLLALLLIWITTEISQRVYFDDLIFWLSFVSGFGLLGRVQTDIQKSRL